MISSSYTSYSSRILPTISSSISSIVTSPEVCPYSSTTIAMCILLDCICLKSLSKDIVSGIKYGFLKSPFMFLTFLSRNIPLLANIRASFKLSIPMMSSISSPYTGYLELLPSLNIKSTTVLRVSSPSTYTIPFLCIITSDELLSLSSKILVIILALLDSSIPCSCPSLTMLIISSSVTFSELTSMSIEKSLSIIFAIRLITKVSGNMQIIKSPTIFTKLSAYFAASLTARRFGTIIPILTINIKQST